jgi:iron complex outermembrane recepter protein
MTTIDQHARPRRGIRLCACLWCCAPAQILTVSLAFAQAQTASAMTPEEQHTGSGAQETLQEVVVTAEKRTELLRNVPVPISVLRGRDLDKSTVEGVSEALNVVPGVATTETYLGGGTNIQMRGVTAGFPLYAGQSTVAYYLDSMPFGLVRSAVGPDADVYDLERIEVLRGPQGTLYGASALNGVVRILTEDPHLTAFDFKARALGSYTENSNGNYRGDAMANVPIIPGALAARATVGYLHDDGWIDQPDKKDANYTDVATYRLKVKGQPTQRLTIDLETWLSRTNSGAPNLGYTWDKSHTFLNEPTLTNYDVYGMKVQYAAENFTVTSQTSHLTYSNAGTLALDIPGFEIPGSVFFASIASGITSEELDLQSTQLGAWRWSAGAMYRKGTEGRVQSYTVLQIPTIQYLDTSKSYAVYGQLTRLFLSDRLAITLGLRDFHDDISQQDQLAPGAPYVPASSTAHANTPTEMIAWHATPRLMFYESFSEGFRSGFPQDEDVLAAYPEFPPVKPDTLDNYELGAKGSTADDRVAFDASIYHMDWKDVQLELSVPIHGVPYVADVNGANALGNGVDLALVLRPLDNLTISPNISWNDLAMGGDVLSNGQVLFRKGDRPSGSIGTTGSLAVAYSFAIGTGGMSGTFSMSAQYSSPQSYRFLAGTGVVVQSGNSIVTSSANFQITVNHWTYTLYGNDLNDEHGIVARVFSGDITDWESRVRPLTVGIEAEYHLH